MHAQDLQGLTGAIAANAQPPGGPLTFARPEGGRGTVFKTVEVRQPSLFSFDTYTAFML